MRPATRLFAAVRNSGPQRTPIPGAPTGLTGLKTHPSPRSTLLFLYTSTLHKLQKFPESSVYRQATEATTKHRLAVVEGIKPQGYDHWQDRVAEELQKIRTERTAKQTKKDLETAAGTTDDRSLLLLKEQEFVSAQMYHKPVDDRAIEWDGREIFVLPEGPRSQEEWDEFNPKFEAYIARENEKADAFRIEGEPLYSISQIEEIEEKIGGGLLEEIIEVAKGEHKLVDVLYENKVWEDLEERSPEGQWSYFERSSTTSTQKP